MSKVAILLCTYNGQQFLAEQLDSYMNQSHPDWEVWASDDGSDDKTIEILESYKKQWLDDRISIFSGPAKGFAANFLALICKKNIKADFYAYSDQDDIWETNKLTRALEWLTTIPQEIPALYCGRTRLVDEKNNNIGFSPLFVKPPSFSNALIQNIGGGNTMVINNAARSLIQEAGDQVSIITHDWWSYIIVAGCGGKVFYDPEPTLRYRQHDYNLVGMNSTWSARFRRVRMLQQKRFRQWNDMNINALSALRHRLTPKNLEIFDNFTRARNMSLIPRLINFYKSGVYRQTLLGNFGLIAAAVLNKI